MKPSSPRWLIAFLRRRGEVSNATVALLAALNLLLITSCALAVSRNSKLRAAVAADITLLSPAVGSLAPPLTGTDWRGEPVVILYQQGSRPTLVYTFTKLCPYCLANWLALRSVQRMAPRHLRVVYVDTEDTFKGSYLTQHGLTGRPLLTQLTPASALAYGARAFPQSELLDPDGTVQWSRIGELSASNMSNLESLIEKDNRTFKSGGNHEGTSPKNRHP